MALNDFVTCLKQDVQMAEEAGAEMLKLGSEAYTAYKAIGALWGRISPKVQQFIIRAAALAVEYLGVALAAALALAGITAEGALAILMIVAGVVGAAVLMAAMSRCALHALES